jgi:Leucine-rich repeat (LRR) protein
MFAPIQGSLQVLNMHNNKIQGENLLEMFGTYNDTMVFPNVTRLDLSNNNLIIVPSDLVQGMPLLEILYMHENPKLQRRPDLNGLHKIDSLLFDICPGTNVVGCSSVSLGCSKGTGWISCQNKDIVGDFNLNDDMSEVTHLYLHKNQIRTLNIEMFANASNVEYISLNENQLSVLPVELFDLIPKLRSMILSPGNEAILADHFRCPNNEHRRKRMKIKGSEFWACEEFAPNDL